MRRIVPLTLAQMREIYDLHMVNDFPDNERKPFSMIEKGVEKGMYQCLGFADEERLLAYAIFVQVDNDYMFDYLAVIDGQRNEGVGTEFLQQLAVYFIQANSVIGEVEDFELAKDEEVRSLQLRRYNFYLRNGYVDTGVKVKMFGVDYRILEMDLGRQRSQHEVALIYKKIYRAMLPKILYWTKVKVK